MMDLINTNLDSLTSIGSSGAVQGAHGQHTATITVKGSGSTSAVGMLQGSNNGTDWKDVCPFNAAGTNGGVTSVTWSTDHMHWRYTLSTLVGTSVAVSIVSESVDPGSSLGLTTNTAGQSVLNESGKRVISLSGVSALRKSLTEARSKTGFTGAGATMLNYTHHHSIALKGRFCRVRIAFHGMEAGTFTLAGVKVAAVPQMAASLAVWNAATWVPVTFSGSSTGTVPARQGANKPTVYWSDWVDLPAVDRTDGAPGYVLAVRVLDGGGAYTYLNHELANYNSDLGFEVLPLGTGIEGGWRAYRQGVDGVSVIANFTAVTDADTATVAAVQTMTFDPVITCALFSDSIGQGERITIAQNRSWMLQAAKELSVETGLSLQFFNQAFAGRKQAEFLSTALQYIPQIKPQLVAFPIYTGNDTISSQAQMESYLSQVLQLLDCCASYGSKALIYTAPPVASFSAADNGRRRAINDWARQHESAGNYVLCDMAAQLEQLNSDGTSQLIPAYASTVPPHPNDAGYAVMVPLAKASIRAALAI